MRKYFVIFVGAFLGIWLLLVGIVVMVDPYFHYHSPLKSLYYVIDEQRYQNRGIAKHFDYDAIITGTSLTQDFKASEFDELFGTDSVKLPFSGATFYETKELIRESLESGHELKYVLRSLDINHLVEEKDTYRDDLGDVPYFLYNKSIWDDYPYLCNEDVLMNKCIPELAGVVLGKKPGHTSFDDYSYVDYQPGEWVYGSSPYVMDPSLQSELTDEDKDLLLKNIEANITSLARDNPETTFIYYISPYSARWWRGIIEEGKFFYTCDVIQITMEELLKYDNIELYCYTNRTDLTTNTDEYYCDSYHYISEVNSWILNWVHGREDFITRDNYMDYIEFMRKFYGNYEYYVEYCVGE